MSKCACAPRCAKKIWRCQNIFHDLKIFGCENGGFENGGLTYRLRAAARPFSHHVATHTDFRQVTVVARVYYSVLAAGSCCLLLATCCFTTSNLRPPSSSVIYSRQGCRLHFLFDPDWQVGLCIWFHVCVWQCTCVQGGGLSVLVSVSVSVSASVSVSVCTSASASASVFPLCA